MTIPIAAYKSRPDHLQMAIQSALSQSIKDIEIIVSDDSPDDSLRRIVDTFRDARISYHHNNPRLGVAKNHWRAFENARGEFIAVLNHDDVIAVNFLEKLVNPLLADPNLAIAFCDHWVIDLEGRQLLDESNHIKQIWGRDKIIPGVVMPFYHLFVAQSVPMVMGAVFRKNLFPSNPPDLAGPAYDLWMTYLLCREGRGAYYTPERLSSWRAHPKNITSQGGLDWFYGSAKCWATAGRDANFLPYKSQILRKAAIGYFNCALFELRRGKTWSAFLFGLRSIKTKPTSKGFTACLLPVLPKPIRCRLLRNKT
ncbi:glycosyltransferase family 2 protein [Telmatocola sphagniphila]|uniref:glycosyltransferase family 2 protein n=1 Tax=Telmatocola sphagniphila TaxID=1123043 RepID=UPI0021BCEB21|nr:glycosyltransferase family A protein [Telmatocola sphagniphila]